MGHMFLTFLALILVGATIATSIVCIYPQERVVVKEIQVPHAVHKITIIKTIEVIKEVPRIPREFSSLEELEAWLKDNRSRFLATSNAGIVSLVSHEATDRDDCDDQSLRLQKKAIHDGYLMSVQLVEGTSHMGNLVIIGEKIYYIENTGEVQFIVNKD